jgi:hypothetical protein
VYQIEVSACIPERYRPFLWVEQRESDANCWGTSLFASGVSENRLGADQDLFILKINSPLCRRLDPKEKPTYGDVIRMYWPTNWKDDYSCPEWSMEVDGYCDVHGITYIDENLVFSKKNVSPNSTWRLMDRKSAFSEYSLSEECFHVSRESLPAQCRNKPWAETYRCQSFASYLDAHKDEPGMKQVLEFRKLLSGVQKTHLDLTWKNRALPSFSEIQNANNVLARIAEDYCKQWIHPKTGKTWDLRYGFSNVSNIIEMKKNEKNPVFWSMAMMCQEAKFTIFPNEIRYDEIRHESDY